MKLIQKKLSLYFLYFLAICTVLYLLSTKAVIYTSAVSRQITTGQQFEFSYCSMLNQSIFAYQNMSRRKFRKYVDTTALEITQKYRRGGMLDEEMKRFACFMTVVGKNEFLDGLQSSKPLGLIESGHSLWGPDSLLIHVHPPNYFQRFTEPIQWVDQAQNSHLSKEMNYFGSFQNTITKLQNRVLGNTNAMKSHYKIVYIILVHKDVEQIKSLLGLLHNPNGFYLIHIDKKSVKLLEQVKEFVVDQFYSRGLYNIKVVSRWDVVWGGGSIVTAQIDLFFQSLHISFDYIINMSGYCLPLYSTNALHKLLKRNNFKAWMSVNRDTEPERVHQVWIPNREGKLTEIDQWRNYKPNLSFPPWKQDQWMILSREIVEWMRDSPETFDLLAWFEYTFIPDEHYFATLLMAVFPHDLFTGGVWIRHFRGDFHPIWLKKEDLLEALPNQYFARKIHIRNEPDLIKYLQEKWIHDEKLLLI
jgi:hypothetical protein